LRRGVVFLLSLVALLALAGPAGAGRLVTAFQDPVVFSGPEANVALARARAGGASMVRIFVNWRSIAPSGTTRPEGFVAENPRDSHYKLQQWATLDTQIRTAVDAGLEPFVYIVTAPDWAEGAGSGLQEGTVSPDPEELGLFAKAAATRYNGDFDPDEAGPEPSLPRIRYWEVWNETNLALFFWPQYVDGRLFSPRHYRAMVNQVAAAVHGVKPDNVVIAGALAPFGRTNQPAPLRFMRTMLCMSSKNKPRAGCSSPARFDIWSHHPYSPEGPNYDAPWPDDVSIGDLPRMRSLLTAAAGAGHILSSAGLAKRSVPLWVTEFSWDTRGPDPKAVPLRLHARWTAEALFRMSRAGVSLVTWFGLRDMPFPKYWYQSGFYFCGAASSSDDSACENASIFGDAKKTLSFKAFRFPFVAFAHRGRLLVWGRTPPGTAGLVRIERRTPSGWKRVTRLRPNADGIFSKRWRSSLTKGYVRARLSSGEAAVPFSLKRPARLRVAPFGCGGDFPC
jgi:hypothetical protein